MYIHIASLSGPGKGKESIAQWLECLDQIVRGSNYRITHYKEICFVFF